MANNYEPKAGDWVQFYYGNHLIIDEVRHVTRKLGGRYVGTLHHGEISFGEIIDARTAPSGATPGDNE